ncbi:hypothetical protein [Planomonospora sp. ID82291]|uniref:hypothetical protein n=1 Tax=Planomonospora sp. ID82291 TaxID=2738136 RepID=UPI0027DCE186|nr:hypothetical protein [Planomonospora sp. ID82291]
MTACPPGRAKARDQPLTAAEPESVIFAAAVNPVFQEEPSVVAKQPSRHRAWGEETPKQEPLLVADGWTTMKPYRSAREANEGGRGEDETFLCGRPRGRLRAGGGAR